LKEYIKSRDGYICLNIMCGNKVDLVVHHIDYNKENCEDKNLITLCRSCNFKVNYNRKWNTEMFSRIMKARNNK